MPLFGRKKAEPTPTSRKNPLVPTALRVERLVWLGLKAADLLGESVFLEEKLQLRFADEGNSGEGHHIRYRCGAVELELLDGGMTWISRPRPKNGSPDIPLVVSFEVDELAPLVEQLSEKEVLVTQIFDQDWVASALFFDPERNIWQVEQLRTAPPVRTNALTQVGTVWLECQDFERQVMFYRDTLGMPLVAAGGGVRPVTAHTETERRHPHVERPASEFEQIAPEADERPVAENVATTTEVSQPEGAQVEKVEAEPALDGYMPPPDLPGLDPLPIETPEQLEASLVGQNPPAAIFFDTPAHLALVPGGRKPASSQNRVWGRDVNLTLSFQCYDVARLALKLRDAGYSVTQPTRDPDTRRGLSCTFSDPEGNVWQVAQWPQLPT